MADYIPSPNLNPLSPLGQAVAKGTKVKAHKDRIRPTKAELEKRVDRAIQIISKVGYMSEAKQLLIAEFEIDSKTASLYLSRARAVIKVMAQQPLDHIKQESYTFYRQKCFDPSVSDKDQIAARTRIDKLFGVDAPISVSVDELDRLIDLEQQRIAGLLTAGSVEGELVTDSVTPVTQEEAASDAIGLSDDIS